MKVLFTMRESLADDNLLGLALKGPSWDKWKILLIAAAGEELTEDERVIYKELTGRDREPGRLVEVMLIIAGRRSGKSKAMSVFSLWLACCCDWSEDLSIGERGRALFVAPRMEQASVIDEYVRSIIEHVELLQSLIDQQTVRSVRLKRKISFEIHPSNAAHVRGMTAISIVLDECAWLPSGDAVNSAEDLMTALQPSLLTTQGPLLLTSSPATSSGLVYEIFRRHYGPDGDPGCIVVQTDTRTLNPKAKQSVIDKAYASDPEAASAEYGGEFRIPISNYLSREVVDRCIDKGVQERSPLPQVSYLAYVDCASGEGKDSMACVVGHKSRDRDRDIVVIDEIIEARPPFNLHDAIEHLAVHLRRWGINSVMGDRYGKPLITFFAKAGLTYLTTPIDTSDVYLHCLPQWTSKSVLMLDRHPRAIDQLVNLRRVSENNREYVKHAKNAHDDLATAICGLIYRLTPLQQVAGTGYPITVVQPVAYPGESSEADDTMRAWRTSHGDAYRVVNQPGSIHHGVRVKVASGRGWLPV